MADTGAIVSLLLLVAIVGIIFFELAGDVMTSAQSYNETTFFWGDPNKTAGQQTTAGRMAVLFGGVIFVVIGVVAIFRKAGLF